MYIPKNKIVTNLYSNGRGIENPNAKEGTSPLINSQTGEIYVGYYWKDYRGKFFTGKNPNDKPTIELILSPAPKVIDSSKEPVITALYTPNFPVLGGENYPYNESIIENYVNLKGLDFTQNFLLPTSYYPKPTQEDYNLGVFTRYFCVKVNEDIYLEIDKKTYDALTNQKEDWLWQLYTPFQLLWTISGEEKEIEKTNYNITLLQEKRLKRRGLQEFLRNNYLKFYPSPYSVSNVTSSITPTTTPVKENKPSIKDLFKITNPRPNLIISPEEIANTQTATPLVTSSVGNPLTGIRVDTSFEDPKSDQRRT